MAVEDGEDREGEDYRPKQEEGQPNGQGEF